METWTKSLQRPVMTLKDSQRLGRSVCNENFYGGGGGEEG